MTKSYVTTHLVPFTSPYLLALPEALITLPSFHNHPTDSYHQWSEADRQAGRAKSNAEAYAKEARAEAIKSVNKFDEKVEEGAAKAKSGISSWFGGSK